MRKLAAGLGLALCLAGSSCIGPNNAYNSVLSWNSKVSDSKFLNELVFLGLNIVPVYQLCLFGDYILFNSVEFWSGENMISTPEPYKPQETK